MPTNLTDKTNPPPGVLPPNIRFVVIAVIAVLVLLTSFFSGRSAKRTQDSGTQPPVAGTTPNQLSIFSKALADQQQAAERARHDAEAARVAEEQRQALMNRIPASYAAPQGSPTFTPSPPVDPFEQDRRKREEQAPFASNIALVAATKPEEHPSPLQNQPPAAAESTGQRRNPEPLAPLAGKNSGSGKYLPEKENGLYRIYESTLIAATLMNRLDGWFTGPVICVVSHDVKSKSGEALLIPKGSRVIGEAKRVESAGQTRLAIGFTRLLLPNGYSVDLAKAPGLNKDGDTGLDGRVNNHYLRTFGISGAIGLLGGLALYGGRTGSGYDYAAGVANAEGSAATTALNHYLNLLPTITIREGHAVNVYLPADLLMPEYDPNGKELKP
jgi:type IV secretion system protein VirB10